MTPSPEMSRIPRPERDQLRTLASRVGEAAAADANRERRRLAIALNGLRAERPMVFTHPERAWLELVPEASLACSHPLARTWERQLRQRLFMATDIRCDRLIYDFLEIPWRIRWGDFGVPTAHTDSGTDGGSHGWGEFPVQEIDRDMPKLRFRAPAVDRSATLAEVALAQETLGGTMPVRIHNECLWWTVGLTIEIIELMGLERLMLAMYDDPEGLHRLMAWKRDETMALLDWAEREVLLYDNFNNDNVGSGGSGLTDALPGRPWAEGERLRLADTWGFCESQETVGVSPEMFAEFILPYQAPIARRFGLLYYGCCEALERRFHAVRDAMPNLRKVSVAPWADPETMAAKLGRDFVYCRKPNPTLVCAPGFDEAAIREDLRRTLRAAGTLNLEIILKDTHTIHGDVRRIPRWVEIAREEIARMQ